jgi:pimeloyl-ACP methyl ester carboxylesterase
MIDAACRHVLLTLVLLGCLGPSGLPALTPIAVIDTTVELPGGKVFYRDSGGKGVAVVFLHPSNSLMWEQQIQAVTRAGYRFIAIDYRGMEASASGQAGNLARIDELLDRLALMKVHLVGTGGGSVVATQYALAHPDRLKSLTIGNSLCGLRDPEFNEMEARLRSVQFDAMPREWRELGPTYRALNPEGVKRWLEMSNAVRQRPAAAAGSATPAQGSAAEPSNVEPVTWERLDQLHVPLQMITGDADPYTPPGIMRRFTARLSGSKGVVIADTGHTAYWENPEAFNWALLAFVTRH